MIISFCLTSGFPYFFGEIFGGVVFYSFSSSFGSSFGLTSVGSLIGDGDFDGEGSEILELLGEG